jgi:drug/metabolite transporter (DMT)-like permease
MSACIGVIIHTLITSGIHSLQQPHEIYWLAFALAIFCTVLPSFLMNEGIRIVGSGRAAIFGIFGPVVTLLLAAWILNEALGFMQLLGAGLVIGGVMLVAKK